ncbi:MAG: endonuclease/exonuclease/phosphatase family protein, partial [Candidatus Shapirobacteria bacterium]|nr:endonuclease/exonuclease/phosphatase family protein [Candidatus Shapirobacteria bacterium]
QIEIQKGIPVIMGGDFNEPSHLDWQANTKNLWDHNGAIINWDCSVMLQRAGFKDSYREKYPNPILYPGFTFPAGNKLAEKAKFEKLAWAPDVDERDRIDFIYYYPTNASLSLEKSILVGPSETVIRGKIEEIDSKDKFFTPQTIWPTDHKGNLATFKVVSNK